MQDKVLNIIVTRNNPVLLQHMVESFDKFQPDYPCDFLIVDNDSDSIVQKKLLDNLSKDYSIMTAPNDRVEVSFNLAWKNNQGLYKYYFFLHDDTCANKEGWLKVFVDRINSGYVDEIIKGTEFENIPIGKVGSQAQFWRGYSSIQGYSVQCLFLKEIVKILYPSKDIKMFKYTDCDRILIRSECLDDTNGIRNLNEFYELKSLDLDKYNSLCRVLNKYLQYADEGVSPKAKYPSGHFWNKLCLTSEMINSIDSLNCNWRTVGLDGDGYLEEIHGYDEPWGHKYLHHYGSPNFREFIAKKFMADSEEIKTHFSDKAFLTKMDRLIRRYFCEL